MASFELSIDERSVLTDIDECWFLAVEDTKPELADDELGNCACELLGRVCSGECE